MISGGDNFVTFRHCGFYSAPVVACNQANARFDDCIFQHTQQAALSCYTANVSIQSCHVSACGYGVAAGAHGTVTCARTTVDDCASYGLLVSSGAALTAESVDLSGCECGVHVLHAGSSASLMRCKVTAARGAGVHVDLGATCTLAACDLVKCGTNAPNVCDSGSKVTASCTEFTHSGESGAWLTRGAALSAANCGFASNKTNGVAMGDSSDQLEAKGCCFKCNGHSGIWSCGGAVVPTRLSDCFFHANKHQGHAYW